MQYLLILGMWWETKSELRNGVWTPWFAWVLEKDQWICKPYFIYRGSWRYCQIFFYQFPIICRPSVNLSISLTTWAPCRLRQTACGQNRQRQRDWRTSLSPFDCQHVSIFYISCYFYLGQCKFCFKWFVLIIDCIQRNYLKFKDRRSVLA